ncbi:hypothetical protein, partial [Komagataeibacter xylinus]|uniref:hypothetical protein n=1 Tax=Komagataeibacter xylinus TaxID=28448 RepID=UPI001A91D01F
MLVSRHFLQSGMKALPWNTFVGLQETLDVIAHQKRHPGPYDFLRPVPVNAVSKFPTCAVGKFPSTDMVISH